MRQKKAQAWASELASPHARLNGIVPSTREQERRVVRDEFKREDARAVADCAARVAGIAGGVCRDEGASLLVVEPDAAVATCCGKLRGVGANVEGVYLILAFDERVRALGRVRDPVADHTRRICREEEAAACAGFWQPAHACYGQADHGTAAFGRACECVRQAAVAAGKYADAPVAAASGQETVVRREAYAKHIGVLPADWLACCLPCGVEIRQRQRCTRRGRCRAWP